MDIIIFAGQSNMQGQSDRLSDSNEIHGAYEYKLLSGSIVPLKNPVGENVKTDLTEGYTYTDDTDQEAWLADHALGSACYGHTCLVPKFCEEYVRITGREVTAVHAAKGSTEIKDWLPGSSCYDVLLKKSKAAKNCVHAEHVFFVWLQGESDAIEGNSKEYYKSHIKTFNKLLKEELGIEKFGIIRVGRFTMDQRDHEIISAQDEVCRESSDFLMLTEIATELFNMPGYMHPGIHGHFSAMGLERLGLEAGRALAEAVK